jgi:hypothetical protein
LWAAFGEGAAILAALTGAIAVTVRRKHNSILAASPVR